MVVHAMYICDRHQYMQKTAATHQYISTSVYATDIMMISGSWPCACYPEPVAHVDNNGVRYHRRCSCIAQLDALDLSFRLGPPRRPPPHDNISYTDSIYGVPIDATYGVTPWACTKAPAAGRHVFHTLTVFLAWPSMLALQPEAQEVHTCSDLSMMEDCWSAAMRVFSWSST